MATFKPAGLCAIALAGLVALGATLPAAAAPDRARVIVKYKAGASAEARAAIARLGGRVVVDLDEVDAVAITLPRRAAALLERSRAIEFVEDDTIQRQMAVSDPSGPPYELGQQVPYGIKMVQADQVSDSAAGNRTVCIIDSGIDGSHPDHAGNLLSGENLTTSGVWNSDESGHGTHVAGTVAAVNQPNIGVVGVLPNKKVNLYIAKVFDASGSTSSSTIAKAMLRCRKNGNADVISMSLGGAGAGRLQQIVVTFLANRNILLLAAAGNGGTNAYSYPASYAEVMSVAAVDINMAHASFSQFNDQVEIAAPGVDVLSTVPVGSNLEATLNVGASNYGVLPMDGSPVASATGPLADFGFGDTPVPGSMTGKVCLISRGNISFADKVLNCQASGGIGAVIYNNTAGALNGTLGGVATTIPSVGALQSDGATMLGQLGQSATVAVAVSTYDYALFNGTSMATPHASAVAALVWSHHPGCTAAEMRSSLTKSAMDLGPAGRDDQFGHGLIQAKAAVDRITALGCGN